MYQTPITIKQALDSINRNLYVLPAIQREFVWKPGQVCRLFDSLMQGYPFGTFLFWDVQPQNSGNYKFYGFVQNYHQLNAAHNPELGALPNQALTAVLDGQQRLTALNIGLRGSMAVKEPNLWWNNPNAFPQKTLYLDLLTLREDAEDGTVYRFRFLQKSVAEADTTALWYPVSKILSVTNQSTLAQWLFSEFAKRNLGSDSEPFNQASATLFRLHEVVHNRPNITCYKEQSQDLEKVLQIFIRMNSGGTVLSYSDLLLSIAVASTLR